MIKRGSMRLLFISWKPIIPTNPATSIPTGRTKFLSVTAHLTGSSPPRDILTETSTKITIASETITPDFQIPLFFFYE